MQPHQQRVVTELEELNEKRSKLDTFLKGDIFKSLNGDEQLRLAKQFRVMGEYAEILYQRIANFA